jgi:hypothetical protein
LPPHAGDNPANTLEGFGTELRSLAKPQFSLEWDDSVVSGFCSSLPVFNDSRLQETVPRRPPSHISKLIEQMEEGRKPSSRTFSFLIPLPKTQQLAEGLLVSHYQKNASGEMQVSLLFVIEIVIRGNIFQIPFGKEVKAADPFGRPKKIGD